MHLIRKISPKITTDKTLMQTKRKRTQTHAQKTPKISITCNTVVTMTLQKKKAKQREALKCF